MEVTFFTPISDKGGTVVDTVVAALRMVGQRFKKHITSESRVTLQYVGQVPRDMKYVIKTLRNAPPDVQREMHRCICEVIKERVYYQLIINDNGTPCYYDHDDIYENVMDNLVKYTETKLGRPVPRDKDTISKLMKNMEGNYSFAIEKTVVDFDY